MISTKLVSLFHCGIGQTASLWLAENLNSKETLPDKLLI